MLPEPTDLCTDFQPQLAAYALGEVEADDELLIHLRACMGCQRDLRTYVQVARALPYDAPEATPPPELRERILAAVDAVERSSSVKQPAEQAASPRPSRWRRWR